MSSRDGQSPYFEHVQNILHYLPDETQIPIYNSPPSQLYRKYFDIPNSNIVFVGKLPKSVAFRNQRGKCHDLENMIRGQLKFDWNYEKLHGLAQLNQEAAFMDLAKYNKRNIDPPEEAEKALELMYLWYRPFFRKTCVPLSDDETFQRTPHSTVPGIPWSRLGETKKTVMETQIFQSWFQQWWDSGCPPCALWSTALKEEIRPWEKLVLNKIRTFIIAPLHHVYACEKLFGAFLDQFMAAWYPLGHAVGFDKTHRGWDRLFSTLEEHEMGSAEDAKQWDSSFKLWLLHACCVLLVSLCNFNDPKNETRAWNLFADLFESIVVTPDGEIFIKWTGNNTGWWGTALFNCLGNTVVTFVSAVKAYKKLYSCSEKDIVPEEFFKWFAMNWKTFCMGDDKISVYSQLVRQRVALSEILSAYEACGFGVETQSDAYQHFREMPFLGCRTVVFRNTYVPVIDRDRMRASLIESNLSTHPARVLVRINAIRRETFFDPEMREEMYLIREAWIDKWSLLYSDDLEWINALRSCDTDRDLLNLYLSFESLDHGSNEDLQA